MAKMRPTFIDSPNFVMEPDNWHLTDNATEEEKKQIVDYRLEKSKKTLEDAKKVIELEMWVTAANRLYYAAYYAVSALLISNNINAKTHDGIIRMFNQHFVYAGKIDRELARQYNSL